MVFRSKSPQRVLDEVSHLQERYMRPHGVVLLRAADQILDMRYFDEVLPRIQQAASGVPIFYETKSNLTREQVQVLRDARVKMIQPGIESLSTPVLALMKKGCTMLQNVQLLKWCAEVGITPIWNLLYGFPGEDPADYDRMATVIPRLIHLPPPTNVDNIRLDRFSPYFKDPASHGIVDVRRSKLASVLYPFSEEAQRAISYRFDFSYGDGRALTYARGVIDAATQWMAVATRGCVVGFVNGDNAVIWDTRFLATGTWTRLQGLYVEALLHCDRVRSERSLGEFFRERVGAGGAQLLLAHFVGEMDRRAFVLREGAHILSLVVLRRGVRAPKLPARVVTTIEPPEFISSSPSSTSSTET